MFLLEHGADINKGDEDGATILYFAAMYGRDESVRMLLERGASANVARSTDGMTPLHIACQERRSAEVVRALLEEGANVEALDSGGRTALIIACSDKPKDDESGDREDAGKRYIQKAIISLLLKHGSNLSKLNDQGQTPVEIADGEIQDMLENWVVARAVLVEDVLRNVFQL